MKSIIKTTILLGLCAPAMAWTDHLNNLSNWTIDEESQTAASSGVWAQVLSGNTKQFCLINYPAGNPAYKSRFEIRRSLMNYNKQHGTQAQGQISVAYDIPLNADGTNPATGQPWLNDGGWIFQTMAWNVKHDANGVAIPRYQTNGFYAPMAIVSAWGGQLVLTYYNNLRYSSTSTDGLGGYYYYDGNPVSLTISPGRNVRGTTFVLSVQTVYSTAGNGSIVAWIEGDWNGRAVFNGATYSPYLPNGNVQFKAGTYSTYYGSFHSKVGLDYVWVNFPYGGYN